ncbi:type II toxin-antitoxin system RelE/ParE family toxin [Flavobacterium sp.]|uniref:type II toxin-antitoxin system RelE/ParE family toxin n=1 Tax=Flavobacterium sp. TaxID=239 RepID=UPI00286DF3C7|nr:type II toxin-antitoxin system RelE/ParE family toxin [Flavobacterium sp.]
MEYKIKIDEDALLDIKNASFWYGNQLIGLDIRYKTQVIKQINRLKKNPYIFAIKYNNIRCIKIEKFPFLVHYSINDDLKLIEIFSVIHTSRSPEIWLKNK